MKLLKSSSRIMTKQFLLTPSGQELIIKPGEVTHRSRRAQTIWAARCCLDLTSHLIYRETEAPPKLM